MAHLPLPDLADAPPAARPVLQATQERWGYLPNIVRALALRPELLEAEDVWAAALMRKGTLPRALKEQVATVVSAANACDYCASSHAHAARMQGVGKAQAEACRMLRLDALGPRERAAADFARKAARDVRRLGGQDIAALRAHFSPEQVVELVAVVASFMMYNTFVTALGLEVEPELRRAGAGLA